MNINSIDINNPQRFNQFRAKTVNYSKIEPAVEQSKKKSPSEIKTRAALISLVGTGTVLSMIAKKQ